MGADVRGTRGQQRRDDPAAWSTWAGLHNLNGLFFRAMVHVPVCHLISIYSVKLFN